jgi:hypothetical protein
MIARATVSFFKQYSRILCSPLASRTSDVAADVHSRADDPSVRERQLGNHDSLHATDIATTQSNTLPPTGSKRSVDRGGRRDPSRTADRYWILQYGDEELRFSLKSAGERWASMLAARGISSELTWHGKNSLPDSRTERTVGGTDGASS